MSGFDAEASVVLTHAVGLHARPSVKLTKLAKTFAAKLELAAGPAGPWIDAKSIVKVMAAKAPQGTVLSFRATGADAAAAVAALVALVERDFDEGEGTAEAAGTAHAANP
ncbi:HPr family phosphocarrier protein [Prosthecomicrobium pneumaticum]|uniref:Phosphocarrier protein HPr n=1 Tax=Prosthecomicrobium pneumaticum TaxID=81895 RepID=A0A7W9L389_9HYPH|nr:HPr family phosphocarrier protein [Prosthecomicrobium pneumaticum]MBB5754313.1 phosphocarrier protein [Prosthecomicrobium pneumaticum]